MTHEPSKTTQALVDMLLQRDAAGRAKYGTTLDRTDLTHAQWLQHMVEELLDAAGYALAAKREADIDALALQALAQSLLMACAQSHGLEDVSRLVQNVRRSVVLGMELRAEMELEARQ